MIVEVEESQWYSEGLNLTTGFLTLVDLLGVAVAVCGCDHVSHSSAAGETGVCTWTPDSGLTGVMGGGGVCSSGNMGTEGCSVCNPRAGTGGVEDWGPGPESKLRPCPFS